MKIFSYLKPVAMILITKQEIKVKYVFGIIKSIDYEQITFDKDLACNQTKKLKILTFPL